MSESTGLLIIIVFPGAVLITLIIATLLFISYTLRRKRKIISSSKGEIIEEYASAPISPVDSKSQIVPPPVPSSPRPNAGCCSRQESGSDMPQEAAYAELEDPAQKNNSNRYSLDLTLPTALSSTTCGGHANEQGPVYHELENPENSMLLKNREKFLKKPVYEMVASTATSRAKLPSSATAICGSDVSVTYSTKNMHINGGATTPYSTK